MNMSETFGRPSSFGRPGTWARPTTKEEIAREYRRQILGKNIPRPWDGKRLAWAPGRLIETLPSVIQTGPGVSGPSRTVLAQIMRERPLLRLLRGPEGYRGLGRPSDPNVVAISPGWEAERPSLRAIMESMGSDVVSLERENPGNGMALEWST